MASSLSLPPGAGMCFVVNAGEVLEVKMSVNLGRGYIGVSEQLLHASQITTRFK